jgi:hypothetical protein
MYNIQLYTTVEAILAGKAQMPRPCFEEMVTENRGLLSQEYLISFSTWFID